MSKIHISNSTIKFVKTAQGYPKNFENFWENIPERSSLSKSEFIKNNGGTLSRANYEYLMENAKGKGLTISTNSGENLSKAFNALRKIKELEKEHEPKLIELAKKTVAEEWDVDVNELDASFMDGAGPSGQSTQHETETEVELTPELYGEVAKRMVLNSLSQGASLHSLLSFHHKAKEEIGAISSELLGLYDEFASLVSQDAYFMSPEFLESSQSLDQLSTGWSEMNQESENVEAKGMTFSIICQELVKGLVAKYTNTQFNNESRQERGLNPLTEDECKAVLNAADDLQYESFQIQFGTELWRRFLSASGEDVSKIDLISYIGAGETSAAEDLMDNIVNNPEVGSEQIQKLEGERENSGFGFEEYSDDEDSEGLDIPEDEKGESPDDWSSIQEDLFGKPKEEPSIDVPEDEKGESPDDWSSIQEDLFGKPKKNPLVDQGLPPVKFDDDDDDLPFTMKFMD